MTTFLRLLEADADQKGSRLNDAITAWRSGSEPDGSFQVDPKSFQQVPGSPFAYWVSPEVLDLFRTCRPVSGHRIAAQFGSSTKDDFRFLRCWWEPGVRGESWYPYPKGGPFARIRAPVPLVINWSRSARELEAAVLAKYPYLKGNASWVLHPESSYGQPGITWTRRTTSSFSCRALPHGCVFGEKGLSAFCEDNEPARLLATLGIFNSRPFGSLVDLQVAAAAAAARSYEIGIINSTPFPIVDASSQARLAALVERFWTVAGVEMSCLHVNESFLLPAVLQSEGKELRHRLRHWAAKRADAEAELARIMCDIDDLAFRLYGIDGEDRRQMEEGFGSLGSSADSTDAQGEAEEEDEEAEGADPVALTEALLEWILGSALGRFDVRLATGERQPPPEPDPFDPLPICSPGMLQDVKGLPATAAPPGYPLELPPHGILVDDPGHPWDVVSRVEAVIALIGGGYGHGWIEEAETILGCDLRDWLRHYGFERHLRRYSRSRRKAPLFWHLAPRSREYGIWLYSPVATRDTVYRILNDYVDPRRKGAERRLLELRQEAGDRPTAQQRRDLAAQQSLVEELRAFREELARVAPLWAPYRDDGVVLNCAPLWRLFDHHRAWQKECKAKWGELANGKYDWAGWAMRLWSERVVRTCASDRSIAIAHGLEEALWEEAGDGKWESRADVEEQVAKLVQERRSAAIQAALDEFMRAT